MLAIPIIMIAFGYWLHNDACFFVGMGVFTLMMDERCGR